MQGKSSAGEGRVRKFQLPEEPGLKLVRGCGLPWLFF